MAEQKLIFLDTCIYGKILDNADIKKKFSSYCIKQNYKIAVTEINLSELTYAPKLHDNLIELLKNTPSLFLKPASEISIIEFKNYPDYTPISDLILMDMSKVFINKKETEKFKRFLISKELRTVSDERINYANQMNNVLIRVMNNFPRAKSGKFELFQAKDFADRLTIQFLTDEGCDIKNKNAYVKSKSLSQIKSIQSYCYFLFYKHYLDIEKPNSVSDFGDLFTSFYFPYCEVSILERNNHNIINKHKNSNPLFCKKQYFDINFLRKM